MGVGMRVEPEDIPLLPPPTTIAELYERMEGGFQRVYDRLDDRLRPLEDDGMCF